MENSQLAQPAKQDERIKTEAERLFRNFWLGVLSRNAGGLLTELDNGKKVFSFESYLREKGKGEYIDAYCSHIKNIDYVSNMVTFNKKTWLIRTSLNLSLIFLLSLLPGIFLYLLLVAFLATFDISFWSWLPALLFALTGPALAAMVVSPDLIRNRAERKAGNGNVQYIVKNFDNDELTFLRTQSKLFKEE